MKGAVFYPFIQLSFLTIFFRLTMCVRSCRADKFLCVCLAALHFYPHNVHQCDGTGFFSIAHILPMHAHTHFSIHSLWPLCRTRCVYPVNPFEDCSRSRHTKIVGSCFFTRAHLHIVRDFACTGCCIGSLAHIYRRNKAAVVAVVTGCAAPTKNCHFYGLNL